jgi:hypothetical protein
VPDSVLGGARALAMSPNGDAVVVAGEDGIELLMRDQASGRLRREACAIPRRRRGLDCLVVSALAGARAVALSPDGQDVYVGARDGLVILRIGVSA